MLYIQGIALVLLYKNRVETVIIIEVTKLLKESFEKYHMGFVKDELRRTKSQGLRHP